MANEKRRRYGGEGEGFDVEIKIRGGGGNIFLCRVLKHLLYS